jgi:regulator of cell morphogenesis and NO signaling
MTLQSSTAASTETIEAAGEWEIPESTGQLVAYILERFHKGHRRDLPGLIVLARKVEGVHGAHPEAPKGLADFLDEVAESLEEHMQKEEQILFPLIERGGHPMISHPIAVMRHEHEDHGINLDKLAALTNNFQAPAGACGSWRGLYEGLAELSAEVREHIRTENDILFPRFGA